MTIVKSTSTFEYTPQILSHNSNGPSDVDGEIKLFKRHDLTEIQLSNAGTA
jgi:hypothetical protein